MGQTGLAERGGERGVPGELRELRIPLTVRLLARSLRNLPPAAQALLRAAAASTGSIDFEVVRRVSGLDERAALDALDTALRAKLLVTVSEPTVGYDFTHALVRRMLYNALSPVRRARLHRAIAEAMEEAYGARRFDHAPAIATHFHHSRDLPGAERGAMYAVAAAEQADATGAHADAVRWWQVVLDLLPSNDARRCEYLARLSLSLTRGLDFTAAPALPERVVQDIGRASSACSGPGARPTGNPDDGTRWPQGVVLLRGAGTQLRRVLRRLRQAATT
jgi:predicted ATPase